MSGAGSGSSAEGHEASRADGGDGGSGLWAPAPHSLLPCLHVRCTAPANLSPDAITSTLTAVTVLFNFSRLFFLLLNNL